MNTELRGEFATGPPQAALRPRRLWVPGTSPGMTVNDPSLPLAFRIARLFALSIEAIFHDE
jgi:hypothetical protein